MENPTVDSGAGRIVTLFRTRLAEGEDDAYASLEIEVEAVARSMPGFIELTTYRADDGERISVVVFASLPEQRAWRDHPIHRRAQELGRSRFLRSYSVTICEQLEERRFDNLATGGTG